MPFLIRAAAVTMLTAEQNEHQSGDQDSVIAYLGEHGVKAEGQRLSSSESGAAAVVLRATQDASLLVMGAYGHSRIGEWIFGGFTRIMLQESLVPLLMAN